MNKVLSTNRQINWMSLYTQLPHLAENQDESGISLPVAINSTILESCLSLSREKGLTQAEVAAKFKDCKDFDENCDSSFAKRAKESDKQSLFIGPEDPKADICMQNVDGCCPRTTEVIPEVSPPNTNNSPCNSSGVNNHSNFTIDNSYCVSTSQAVVSDLVHNYPAPFSSDNTTNETESWLLDTSWSNPQLTLNSTSACENTNSSNAILHHVFDQESHPLDEYSVSKATICGWPNDADNRKRASPCLEVTRKQPLSQPTVQSNHTCERCGKQYRHAASLKNHSRKHDSGKLASKRFKCPYCVYSSQYNRNVAKHVEATHRFPGSCGSTNQTILAVSTAGIGSAKDCSIYCKSSNYKQTLSTEYAHPTVRNTSNRTLNCSESPHTSFCGGLVSINRVTHGIAAQDGLQLTDAHSIPSENALQRLLNFEPTQISHLKQSPSLQNENVHPVHHDGTSRLQLAQRSQSFNLGEDCEKGSQGGSTPSTNDIYTFSSSTLHSNSVQQYQPFVDENAACDVTSAIPHVINGGFSQGSDSCTSNKSENAWPSKSNALHFRGQQPLMDHVNPVGEFSYSNVPQNSLWALPSNVGISYQSENGYPSPSCITGRKCDTFAKEHALGSTVEQPVCTLNPTNTGPNYQIPNDETNEQIPLTSTPALADNDSEGRQQVTSETDALLSDLQEILSRDMSNDDDTTDFLESNYGVFNTNKALYSGSNLSGDSGLESMSSSSSCSAGGSVGNSIWGSGVQELVVFPALKNGSPTSFSSTGACNSLSMVSARAVTTSAADIDALYQPLSGPTSTQAPSTAVGTIGIGESMNETLTECNLESVSLDRHSPLNQIGCSTISRLFVPNHGDNGLSVTPSLRQQSQTLGLAHGASDNLPTQCGQAFQQSAPYFGTASGGTNAIQPRLRLGSVRCTSPNTDYPTQHSLNVVPMPRWHANHCVFRPGLEPRYQPQSGPNILPADLRDPFVDIPQQQYQQNANQCSFPNTVGVRNEYEYAAVNYNFASSNANTENYHSAFGQTLSHQQPTPVSLGSTRRAGASERPSDLGCYESEGVLHRSPMFLPNADKFTSVRQQQHKPPELVSPGYQNAPVPINRSIGHPLSNDFIHTGDRCYNQLQQPQDHSQFTHSCNSRHLNSTAFCSTRRMHASPAQADHFYTAAPYATSRGGYHLAPKKPITGDVHHLVYEQPTPSAYSSPAVGNQPHDASACFPPAGGGGDAYPQAYPQIQAELTSRPTPVPASYPFHRPSELPQDQEFVRPVPGNWSDSCVAASMNMVGGVSRVPEDISENLTFPLNQMSDVVNQRFG